MVSLRKVTGVLVGWFVKLLGLLFGGLVWFVWVRWLLGLMFFMFLAWLVLWDDEERIMLWFEKTVGLYSHVL